MAATEARRASEGRVGFSRGAGESGACWSRERLILACAAGFRAQKSGRPGRPRARAGLSRLNSRQLNGRRYPAEPQRGSAGRRTSRGPSSSWQPSWQPSSSSSPSIWLLATSALTHTTHPIPWALYRRDRTTFRELLVRLFRGHGSSSCLPVHTPLASVTKRVVRDGAENCQEKSGKKFRIFPIVDRDLAIMLVVSSCRRSSFSGTQVGKIHRKLHRKRAAL